MSLLPITHRLHAGLSTKPFRNDRQAAFALARQDPTPSSIVFPPRPAKKG